MNEKESGRGRDRVKTRQREGRVGWNSLLGVSEHGKCVGYSGTSLAGDLVTGAHTCREVHECMGTHSHTHAELFILLVLSTTPQLTLCGSRCSSKRLTCSVYTVNTFVFILERVSEFER